ncbi:MAG: hypothetical protein ACJ75D_03970 [Gaiellaceae bacterium]
MAKKSRTPAPPRKVQAPQQRKAPKRTRSLPGGPWVALLAVVALAAVAAAIVAVVVARGGDNNSSSSAGEAQPANLVGLQTGPAPWNPGLDTLPDRLDAVGVHDLSAEGEVVHIHQHLDIFVNGKQMPVPANIGIYDGQFLTELHTHDASGIMHFESPTVEHFDLGQFFGVWGVRLNADCVGGYCRQVTPWTVYIDGRPYSGDPAKLELKSHQEIAFVIGTPPKKIPRSYAFPPNT